MEFLEPVESNFQYNALFITFFLIPYVLLGPKFEYFSN